MIGFIGNLITFICGLILVTCLLTKIITGIWPPDTEFWILGLAIGLFCGILGKVWGTEPYD
jgi:predicted lysophospholipase L1 biosynthesis ABC-type transport system permease subunit